jgi:hypothetical protein
LLDWKNNASSSSHFHRWRPDTELWNSKAYEEACSLFGLEKLEELLNSVLPVEFEEKKPEEKKKEKKKDVTNKRILKTEQESAPERLKRKKQDQVEITKEPEKPKPTFLDMYLKPVMPKKPQEDLKDIQVMDIETDLKLLHKIYDLEQKLGIDKQLALQIKTQILAKMEGIK